MSFAPIGSLVLGGFGPSLRLFRVQAYSAGGGQYLVTRLDTGRVTSLPRAKCFAPPLVLAPRLNP